MNVTKMLSIQLIIRTSAIDNICFCSLVEISAIEIDNNQCSN